MSSSQAVKKNISSIQVMKTLQALLEDNYTMTELITKLNQNETSDVFNHSVVSKYINTCRYLGINIPKIHNKYFVASMPFGMDLTGKDLELLEKLQLASKESLSVKHGKIFDSFLAKLSKYSNKQIARIEEKTSHIIFELFDKAIVDKRKVRLMFRAKAVLDCIPLGIVENKGKTYFNILNSKDKEKLILVDRICGIEVLDERFVKNYSGQVVVYQLKGDLSKRYDLRDNEQLVVREDNSITVSNKGENKEILFSRLLRYDSSCEILHPKHYREEMKNLLDEMLKNYGE